jgi:hypothetical protein
MAVHRLHDPEAYWARLHALPEFTEPVPAGAMKAIERMMPERSMSWKTVHRVAGLGSLGRERYVAIADWRGGSIAREAKALAPSACVWAQQGGGTAPILYQEVLEHSVRSRDPFVRLLKRWIIRRLAPDCSRIELASLPRERDELRLLHAMGFETANVHLGSAKAAVLQADLAKRPRGWLMEAARKMEKAVFADFEAWSTR